MIQLENENIRLRALEPSDIDVIFRWENDSSVWNISDTVAPYSRNLLQNYIRSEANGIYATKQLRLMIVKKSTGETTGMIDLFEFEPRHCRAGVGIFIFPDYRKQGIGKDALSLLINYSFSHLHIKTLFCDIAVDNIPSIKLFEGAGFTFVGRMKSWFRCADGFKDINMYQIINENY